MDERVSSSLAIDRGVETPGVLPPRQDTLGPAAAAEQWARQAEELTPPELTDEEALEEEVDGSAEEAEESKSGKVLSHWLRAIRVRDLRHNRERALHHTIERNQRQVRAFMTMAQYAINLAVKSEPRQQMRNTKRQRLMDRWRGTYQRVFGAAR